jgi:hypothetical protein
VLELEAEFVRDGVDRRIPVGVADREANRVLRGCLRDQDDVDPPGGERPKPPWRGISDDLCRLISDSAAAASSETSVAPKCSFADAKLTLMRSAVFRLARYCTSLHHAMNSLHEAALTATTPSKSLGTRRTWFSGSEPENELLLNT